MSTMQTIEINTLPHPAALYLGALRSSSKRPGAIKALPKVAYVRPEVVLDAADIAAYSKVCGFGAEHGVPITYPQMLAFPLMMVYMASEHCPWPAMGTVHLANRIHQRQPLHAGDTLRVEVRTGKLMAHEKGQIFTLEIDISRNGHVVWDCTMSLLRIGVKNPVGSAYASTLVNDTALSRQTDFAAPSDIGRRYGSVSGDINPIHLSAISAKMFGFRQAIAHGLWTKARALSALLPRQPLAQAEVNVEFKTPLFLPAKVSLWNTRNVDGTYAHSNLFEVRNAKGDKPHLRGQLSYQAV